MIAVTPALAAVRTPSLKGKKASEAMIRGRYSGSDPTSKRDLAI